jgi:PAS domain S-box-containing protein
VGARSAGIDALGNDLSWTLLDAAPDGMLIVDQNGEIVFVSDQAAALLACTAEDLVGRRVEDLVPEDARPTHRSARARYQAAPAIRPMGAGLQLRARRIDGTEFPVEISLSPLSLSGETYTVAALRNVTERVEAEDYLHRVLHTLDATDDGVFIFDADSLRYSYVNDGAVRLVGYSRDELLTMTPLHLNPRSTAADYRRLIDTLQANPNHAVMHEAVLVAKDGHEIPVEKTFQSAPVGRGDARWVVALARNISERLAAEEELRRNQDALRDAEQVLLLASDRERIARDLHDTVIQRLFGAGLQLQAASAGADELTRERMQATITDLDETIKELRSAIFALQGSGPTPRGLRGRLVDVITDAGAGAGFEPRIQFEGAIETMDERIATHLEAVVREAVTNVARHAEAGQLRVAISLDQEEVILVVTDNGKGVPDDVVGGRGLSNLASRAEELGGNFEIQRSPDGGSRLEWRVPATSRGEAQTADSPQVG